MTQNAEVIRTQLQQWHGRYKDKMHRGKKYGFAGPNNYDKLEAVDKNKEN